MTAQLVFIDDSGDPGFQVSKGSSPVFVIAMVLFSDTLEAEKTSLAIKQLRRSLKVSDSYEFKFNKSDVRFKTEFFKAVCSFDFSVRAIVTRKVSIQSARLRNYKENFYNYMIMQVLKNNSGKIKNAKLIFDKHGEKMLRDQLRVYLSAQLNNKSLNIFKDLKFVDSRQNTLVQLADMVAGSINWSTSKKDPKFLNMLRKTGRIDNIWEFK